MQMKLGVIMDPIQDIKILKDSTFAMLLEAQKRGYAISYMELTDLFVDKSVPFASMRNLKVWDDKQKYFELGEPSVAKLTDLNIILMRKDPPVNMQYIYATQILELAANQVFIANNPRSLRDFNEKLIVNLFPQCCPPTLVSADAGKIKEFLVHEKDIVCKPLDGMGGQMVFRVTSEDPNINVIIETLSDNGKRYLIAQKYLPQIKDGDKRILLIDGEPVDYSLARIAKAGETRANLAAGGQGKGVPLTARDKWICDQLRDFLRAKGLFFVGIDVIGDYLTEINITSPTCIRELDKIYNLNISAQLLDALEKKLTMRS